MQLKELLGYFEKVRKIGTAAGCKETYEALCPSHRDKKASLHISETQDGKILLHCKAGCNTGDVLADVGLTMADLGEKPTLSWQKNLEDYIKKPMIDYYHYEDEEGRYLFTKLRFQESDGEKAIRYGQLNKQKDFMKLGKGCRAGSLYNLPALLEAIRRGFPVYIVEGEKDVETMKRLGLTATTAGGTSDWKKDYAKYFIGARVVILPDNDKPGQDLAGKIEKDLRDYAHSIKMVTVSKQEHGDVTDYLQGEGSKEELLDLIQREAATLAPWVYLTGKEGKERQNINIGILSECICKNNNLFVARNPGTESDLIYWYKKGAYRMLSRTELIGKVRPYVPSSLTTPNLLKNVADNITYFCQVKDFTDLNMDERYINVKNGLYDIQTGTLVPHTPELISTIQLDCCYPEKRDIPHRWVEFIQSLCLGLDEEGNIDTEMFNLIQEWAGLLLSNIPGYRVKKCMMLYSALGDTGKSVFLSTMSYILGQKNVANVSFQKMDSSRWATGNIYGKRGVMVGDQSSEDIQDSSVFKQLTGGDIVSAELKGKQCFSYRFTGCIVAACNNLPAFRDDKGGHMFERLSLIHCRNTIPKEKQDKSLADKLRKEADQIFLWALDGLHRLIEKSYRFTECKSSVALMKEYRSKVDSLYRFIQDNCLITEDKMDRIPKTQLEQEYEQYCTANGFTPIGKRSLPARFAGLGFPLVPYKGYQYYRQLKWKEFRNWSENAKF